MYNTGNTFSLATEEFSSLLGITFVNSNGRNNYRLPDFHHLSLKSAYTIKKEKFDLQFNLNVYNVYNRLNAYYIYIYKNPIQPNDIVSKKVRILPIAPTFIFKPGEKWFVNVTSSRDFLVQGFEDLYHRECICNDHRKVHGKGNYIEAY